MNIGRKLREQSEQEKELNWLDRVVDGGSAALIGGALFGLSVVYFFLWM